jgi:hypothetical protein
MDPVPVRLQYGLSENFSPGGGRMTTGSRRDLKILTARGARYAVYSRSP